MFTNIDRRGKDILERIARRVMRERGFEPDFSSEAMNELSKIIEIQGVPGFAARDLRGLPWASIDNDDSLDLDQLTVAESLPDNMVRIRVAIADVDVLVKKDTAIDQHAHQNTTSIYTAGKIFPMLPEKLSTDLTSLNFQEDRSAIVIDMVIDNHGEVQKSDIYLATVHNHAKLAYRSVGAWLEATGPVPDAITAVPALTDNLRLQDRVAQKLKARRYERGALDLQTLEARPVFDGDVISDLQVEVKNRATGLIEDFMIAANDVVARFLRNQQIPSLRRIVRTPKRWDRIVEIASLYNYRLPLKPDSKALALFLAAQREADPVAFPDLSLSVIKLLGSGEYVVELTGEIAPGHFGLAVQDYMHSTAPNRRFPDLITQRILKASLGGSQMPYRANELAELAAYCTQKEDDANKVERLVAKSAAAMLLSSRMGARFDAICTGAADKGTWVRIFNPPVEGRLISGFKGIDVGTRLKVQLIHTDIERGFIDFKKA
jgi:VacB/RNase II family 3'-5' exoribonuclease